MKPAELQDYLHGHIPLSAAMGVVVISADAEAVVLGAPLAPNINHRDTVFGGSASALAILAAWSLVHVRLRLEGITSRIVIQRNTTQHDLPIPGEFVARAFLDEPESWQRFLRILKRRGRGRVVVSAVLEHDGGSAGRFKGVFVALDGPGESRTP